VTQYVEVARAALLCATVLVAPACKLSEAATSRVTPPGEVWLTQDQARAANIVVQPAEAREFDDTIVTSGHVTFDDMRVAHVFSPVTGRVVSIAARLGQHVKRGAPLATLESPDIGIALSEVNKALADSIASEHDYQRQKELAADRATSEAVLEQSEDNWRKARAELERARSKARLLHAGDGESVSQGHTLVSPIDGEIVARNINPGMEVLGQYASGTAQELFTVGELDEVWVLGDIYEVDIAKVRVGLPVSITVVSSQTMVLPGTVDWVSSTLDPDTRTAKVRCRLHNPDDALRPEMFATMRVSVDRRRALAVPRSAVLRLGGYHFVFVQLDDVNGHARFARVPVDVDDQGLLSDAWVVIKHGVEPGQKVVASGAEPLTQML
jgi:cobalt-zinc-cadmium efflux system membrane fusion protein